MHAIENSRSSYAFTRNGTDDFQASVPESQARPAAENRTYQFLISTKGHFRNEVPSLLLAKLFIGLLKDKIPMHKSENVMEVLSEVKCLMLNCMGLAFHGALLSMDNMLESLANESCH